MNILRGSLIVFLVAVSTVVVAASSAPDIERYTAMRWKLFNQPTFNPYLTQAVTKALTDECMKQWRNGQLGDALAKCKEAVAAYPTSILAHRMLADMYQRLAESSTATTSQKERLRSIEQQHRTLAEGVIHSILASGDGKTPDTAYVVITIDEEYMVLWYLGLSIEKRFTVPLDERLFDAFEVRDKAGKDSQVYFDVSSMRTKTAK